MKQTIAKKDLFINGEWVKATNYIPLYSPYTEEKIAEIPDATHEEMDAAITAAQLAKEKFANMPAHQRATILENIARLLEERREEAATIIATEAAKPIRFAKAEVARTIQTYKFAAEEAKRIYGEVIPLDAAPSGENRIAYTVRKPLGVIGAITPFNFPMNLVAHKVGPAIAAGNPIILKPASQTPLSAFFLAEIVNIAGVPKGVLNIVTGSGSTVGQQLVTDNRIEMITFTGSPEVGKEIKRKAGLKRVTLELGSNSAVIIDKNIHNLDAIVERTITGAFAYQGQVCIAVQRIYIHEQVYERFVEKFVTAAKKITLGDPLDESTELSSLITQNDVERSLTWIKEASDNGASIATGGKRSGNILHPTVLLDVDPTLKVSCQEVFAPIVLLNKITTVEKALDEVNDSRFGLQAGIYTNDLSLALHAADLLHVGGVLINDIPTFRVDHMPYGGVKESGIGREGLKYAIEEMTEMKLVIINRNQ